MKRTLYHYTAERFARSITRTGVLVPASQPALGGTSLVWLTDLAEPDAFALGLNQMTLPYDRTLYRFRVTDPAGIVPWARMQRTIPDRFRAGLERGRSPEHWFVTRRRVPVVYDCRFCNGSGRTSLVPPQPCICASLR